MTRAMPLDLNAILAPFLRPLHIQWKTITDAMTSIGKQVKTRLERSSALERTSRDFLMVDFQEMALVVTIAAAQKGALGPRPAEPLWPASIRQELLLPRFFFELAVAVKAILASMKRFKTATPGMFAPKNPQFIDIFGHIGILSRALASDYRPIRLLERTAQSARDWYDGLGLAKSPASEGGGEGLAGLPAKLAGALILIPAFFEWLDAMFRFLDLAVRTRALDEFTALQNRVFGVRRDILDSLFSFLRNNLQDVFEVYFVLNKILLQTVVYWSRFVSVYVGMLGEQLSVMSAFLAKWVNLIIAVADALGGAMNLLRDLELPGGVTLGNLIDYAHNKTGDFILNQLDRLEKATGSGAMNGLVVIYRALMRAIVANPPAIPRPVIPPFPDLYLTGIKPHEQELFDLVQGMRDAIIPSLQQALTDASGKLLEVGKDAAQVAQASTGIPQGIWNSVLGSSKSISDGLFSGADRTVRNDELAKAYERAIVTAGFATIRSAWIVLRSQRIPRLTTCFVLLN